MPLIKLRGGRWQAEIRQSDAVQHLRDGRYDLIPLPTLERQTNSLVIDENRVFPPDQKCDEVLTSALLKVTEWPARDLAVIAAGEQEIPTAT